jgi:hypothetical protein
MNDVSQDCVQWLTATANTYEVFFSQPNSFPATSSQSFDCRLQELSEFYNQLPEILVI